MVQPEIGPHLGSWTTGSGRFRNLKPTYNTPLKISSHAAINMSTPKIRPNNQINGKADGGMNTLCRCAEAMSSAGKGL